MELRWQRDIIKQWLHASQISRDSMAALEAMLASVDRQLAAFETKVNSQGSAPRSRRAG
jgi:hypothetical protein